MNSIQIYTTPSCAFCKMAKEYFRSRNLEYKEFDVASDAEKRMEMIQISGQLAVPVIKINGKIILGFDKNAIDRALKSND